MPGRRETVFEALLARVMGAYAFKRSGRRLEHYNDLLQEAAQSSVPATNIFPACYVVVGNNRRLVAAKEGIPAAWIAEAKIHVYTHDATPGGAPQSQMNDILDAIEAALAPTFQEGGRSTLGGAVRDTRLGGQIDTDEGILGELAVVVIPVEMILPQ